MYTLITDILDQVTLKDIIALHYAGNNKPGIGQMLHQIDGIILEYSCALGESQASTLLFAHFRTMLLIT